MVAGHNGTEWNRYAFSHARVLHDTPDRAIQALVTAKGTATAEESHEAAAGALDAFLNSLYRAAKNARDGNALGARGRVRGGAGRVGWRPGAHAGSRDLIRPGKLES